MPKHTKGQVDQPPSISEEAVEELAKRLERYEEALRSSEAHVDQVEANHKAERKRRQQAEQELERARAAGMALVANVLYQNCPDCGLPEPERSACFCQACIKQGELTQALRKALDSAPSLSGGRE